MTVEHQMRFGTDSVYFPQIAHGDLILAVKEIGFYAFDSLCRVFAQRLPFLRRVKIGVLNPDNQTDSLALGIL